MSKSFILPFLMACPMGFKFVFFSITRYTNPLQLEYIYIYNVPLFVSLVVILVTKLCLILCNPIDYSLPGSSVHGISQAKILEWIAFSFLRNFPDPRIEPTSLALQADSLLLSHLGSSQ